VSRKLFANEQASGLNASPQPTIDGGGVEWTPENETAQQALVDTLAASGGIASVAVIRRTSTGLCSSVVFASSAG